MTLPITTGRKGFVDPEVSALFDDQGYDDVKDSAGERSSHRIGDSVGGGDRDQAGMNAKEEPRKREPWLVLSKYR